MNSSDLSNYLATPPNMSRLHQGAYVQLVPFDASLHMSDLFEAGHSGTRDEVEARWRYLPAGPFTDAGNQADWMQRAFTPAGFTTYVIIDETTGKPQGMASYLRVKPTAGSIEIGAIMFGPELSQTRAATEAIYLLADHTFEALSYRRLEWKCNADNAASQAAARRFGFTFEGIFRQATVVKGKNRDTAWFSIIDAEWPNIKSGFRAWLQADNFDLHLRQKKSLQDSIMP